MIARARSVLSALCSPVHGEKVQPNNTIHKQVGANPAIATTKTAGPMGRLFVFLNGNFAIGVIGALSHCCRLSESIAWVNLAENHEMELPKDVDIYLTTYSTDNSARITAQFSDFFVHLVE